MIRGEATYYRRDVYGQELLYPVSSLARMACELAGTKTITAAMMATLKRHGLDVIEVSRPVQAVS